MNWHPGSEPVISVTSQICIQDKATVLRLESTDFNRNRRRKQLNIAELRKATTVPCIVITKKYKCQYGNKLKEE